MTGQNVNRKKHAGEYRRDFSDHLATKAQQDGYIDLDQIRLQMRDARERSLATPQTA